MAQATAPADRSHTASKRYIYAWGAGTAEGNGTMKDLLGGKGAGLAEMTLAGLPTPPGFTITTEACNDYFANGKQLPAGLWDDTLEAVKEVEERTGKGFGDPANPLLVSVRSGAKFSMPGMMDTVLNLGLNEATLEGLIALSGNERFGWDAYRRFIGMFGRIVMDVKAERFDEPLEARKHALGPDAKDTDLTVDDLKALVDEYKKVVRADTGRDFPTDPYEQLDLAIKAVFASWFGKRANDYRTSQKIAHDLGTAVNVVTMVFGNMGDDSGTGVAFTRNTFDGTKELYGEYLTNAQGEDVVAGIRTPEKISELKAAMPEAYDEFVRIGNQLEAHYRDVQDLEFTIERGRLYMLQTRIAKRTAAAAVKIAVQMVNEGVITKQEAVERIEPAQVDQLLRATFDQGALKGATKIVNGLNASPGAAVGRAVFDADTAVEWVERGEPVILVRVETSPDDFHGMAVAQGIITARGGATSHAAVVARQIGKPCVAGSADLLVDYANKHAACNVTGTEFKEGDWVSLDGSARRAVPRRAADGRGAVRGPARAPADPRLGRRDPPHGGVDQRRQARGGRAGPGLRGGGHRPLPHRAHVPRGRPPRDRARRHPRRHGRDAGQGEGRRRRDAHRGGAGGRVDLRYRDGQAGGAPAGRLRGHLQGDGRPAGRRPPDRPAAPRVPPEPRGAAGQGHPRRGAPAARPRRTSGCSRRSSRCTSRTRCSASAAAAWGS